MVAAAALPPPNPGQQAAQALRVARVPGARSALLTRLHVAQMRAEPLHLAHKRGAQQRCQPLNLVARLLTGPQRSLRGLPDSGCHSAGHSAAQGLVSKLIHGHPAQGGVLDQ